MTRAVRYRIGALLALVGALAVVSCSGPDASAAPERPAAEVDDRQAGAVEPASKPSRLPPPEPSKLGQTVDVADATLPLTMEVVSDTGYEDAEGTLILDVMEGDYLYLTLLIDDAEGRPVQGLKPSITIDGSSRFIPPIDGENAVSDDSGSYSFVLMGVSMGEERVEIVAGDVTAEIILNVISMRAAGFGWLAEIEGVLDWSLLFQAEIDWSKEELTATFPKAVLDKNGQTVQLAGFMIPLEMTETQQHFVLASNPPGCFFHIPGGPTGAVEVFAEEPLAASWDPIVMEGRFEAVETSEIGVLYRLHDARSVPIERKPDS